MQAAGLTCSRRKGDLFISGTSWLCPSPQYIIYLSSEPQHMDIGARVEEGRQEEKMEKRVAVVSDSVPADFNSATM